MKQIKLIWDFRGPDGLKIAQHHHIHLQEFLVNNNKANIESGHQLLSEFHAIAFILVPKDDMIFFRDQLKPHRGELC